MIFVVAAGSLFMGFAIACQWFRPWTLRRTIARAQRELAFVQAENATLRQDVENEQHDVGVLCENLTKVYEHFAGLSKPTTDADAVIEVAEARLSKERDEDIVEAVEIAKEECQEELRLALAVVRAWGQIDDVLTEFDGAFQYVDGEYWDHLHKVYAEWKACLSPGED